MTKILNLKQYDLVLTTSCLCKHGVSGHMYELIDYFMVCIEAGIDSVVLLSDGTTKDEYMTAIKDKYDFTDDEWVLIDQRTIECHQPKILMTNNICLVDGSWRMADCVVYADNAFLFRCSEPEFDYWSNSKSVKKSHVMQDFKLYEERYQDLNVEVVDYVKKILWSRYKHPAPVVTNTAMLYLTTNCRAIGVDEVRDVMARTNYEKFLIVTNNPSIYAELKSDNVTIAKAPIKNIFESFDTFVYTATELQSDCSPRFIVECALYGKKVDYQIDYVCAGVERRRDDIANNLQGLLLTSEDYFIEYAKRHIYA